MDKICFESGNVVVRLAENKEEIFQAQKLRYKELLQQFDKNKRDDGLDKSEYDDFCDHIVAVDKTTNKVVGTYRLMNKEHLKFKNQFICETEFDISKLKNCSENILELGRAVVDVNYRNGVVIKLIWQALFKYSQIHNIRYLFGTASFHGVDFDDYKHAFAYLHDNYMAEESICCTAHTPNADLNLLRQTESGEVDVKLAKSEIPPLVKGYLAMGSKVGKGVFFDYDFNSMDVMII